MPIANQSPSPPSWPIPTLNGVAGLVPGCNHQRDGSSTRPEIHEQCGSRQFGNTTLCQRCHHFPSPYAALQSGQSIRGIFLRQLAGGQGITPLPDIDFFSYGMLHTCRHPAGNAYGYGITVFSFLFTHVTFHLFSPQTQK